jgi:hypothetical protein
MKNQNLVYLLGALVIGYYLYNKKKNVSNNVPGSNELLAIESSNANLEQADIKADYTPEEKIIKDAFNNC